MRLRKLQLLKLNGNTQTEETLNVNTLKLERDSDKHLQYRDFRRLSLLSQSGHVRLFDQRIRTPQLQPQVFNTMRTANQPLQPADIHFPLVLVPDSLLHELLGACVVD